MTASQLFLLPTSLSPPYPYPPCLSQVGEGSISKSLLDPNDVFILDDGAECFVWIGAAASAGERKSAMSHAHAFLMDSDHPVAPITVFAQGKETKAFNECFA